MIRGCGASSIGLEDLRNSTLEADRWVPDEGPRYRRIGNFA